MADVQPARDLYCLVPIYHDVPAFTRLRADVLATLARSHVEIGAVHFVVIDDSAGDDIDVEQLLELPDVDVLRPPYSLGHQQALVLGARALACRVQDHDLVVSMDGDGEDKPEDVPRLLEALDAPDVTLRTIVIAHRTERRVSVAFRLGYLLFRLAFRILVGFVVDSGNFAAYHGWVLRNVLSHPNFDLCYSSSLLSLGLPIVRVPCARGERYEGQSRMNLLRLSIHAMRMMMPFLDRMAVRTLAAFAVMFSIGVALSIAIVVSVLARWGVPTALAYAAGFFGLVAVTCLGNFVLLFATFSNYRGLHLSATSVSVSEPGQNVEQPSRVTA
jgi:hypothetical protein